MTISQWSTTPASNASITDGTYGNINLAEGQAPSTVNDSVRSLMAHTRADYEAGGWTPLGHTAAYVGATQFKVAGVDVSAHYPVGRRVRAVASTPGTIYGRVSAVAFSTDTTVTVQWDSGSLSNEALVVSVGRMTSTGQPTPGDFLGAVNTAKAAAVASATSTDIWAGAGNLVHITGTTTIEDFGTAPKAGAFRMVVFDGALTLTHGASAIVLPGGANITTAAGDTALVYADTTTKHLVTYVKASGEAIASNFVIRGYVSGLVVSNNSSDATNDIDISAGQATDDGNAVLMTLGSGLTKRLDATWAVGTNQGMLASGAALDNGTYHIFLIRRPDTGVVDIAADDNVSGTNLTAETDAAYTQKRLIFSIVRSGGAIQKFLHDGDYVTWETPVQSVSATDPGTSAVTRTVSVPAGRKLLARLLVGGQNLSANWYGMVTSLDAADIAPSATVHNCGVVGGSFGSNSPLNEVLARTNTSSQVRTRISASGGSNVLAIETLGYIERRGRDD